MPRPKIKAATKALIVRLARKTPHLGVRGIARILKQNHALTVSKSSIAAILKKKGFQPARGRKQAVIQHRHNRNQQCGLFLLRCLDSHIGLIDHVVQELKVSLPQLNQEQLKKILIFSSFSAFAAKKPFQPDSKDFLRLAGLSRLPQQAFDYFKKTIEAKKPVISLQTVREGLSLVSTVKFYFVNKNTGFTDAKIATFWDGLCRFPRFYFPLQAVMLRLEQMLKNRLLIVGYTKSFEYLSRLTFEFIRGLQSGIEKIELLDKNGRVVGKMQFTPQKIVLVFGYCPAIVTKGMVVFSEAKRIASISAELGFEFYTSTSLARFIQPAAAASSKHNQAVANDLFLSRTIIKEHFASPFQWGVLSTISHKSRKLRPFLKKYLYMWRYASDDFFEDMEAIQKAVFDHEKKPVSLSKMLPQRLRFSALQDCARISQILSVLFKEVVFGWEPKAKPGSFRLGKEAVCISLKGVPPLLKKRFNRHGFTFAQKPAVIV